jgi:hypothetical protein
MVGVESDADSARSRNESRSVAHVGTRRGYVLATGVAATIMIGLLTVVFVALRSDRSPTDSAPREAQRNDAQFRAPTNAGQEVGLAPAASDVTDYLLGHRNPSEPPTVLAPDGRAAVLLTKEGDQFCVTVTSSPTSFGYQGACRPSNDAAQPPILTVPDTGPVVNSDTTFYVAWPSVPSEAAYATFEFGSVRVWQRPVAGFAVFAFAEPEVRSELAKGDAMPPIILRSFDESDVELSAATRDRLDL